MAPSFRPHAGAAAPGPSPPSPGRLLIEVVLSLVGRFQVFGGYVLGPLRIVLGPLGEIVLVDRPLALAGDVINPAHVDVGPDDGPLRILIAIRDLSELVQ